MEERGMNINEYLLKLLQDQHYVILLHILSHASLLAVQGDGFGMRIPLYR